MVITGKGGISAEVVADSINSYGDRITTLKLVYHRFIHAEFLRHRMFSHSVSSSRAIPVTKMCEQIESNPATPIYWGKNQSGMSANEELSDVDLSIAKNIWERAAEDSAFSARNFESIKLHKQISNRLLEPFQFINQVVTATDFDNFFYLRIDGAAQPEIQELAKVMYEAMQESTPDYRTNTYHLPYITEEMENKYTSEECIKISASVCAQSSYRLSDPSLEKANMIYDKLVNSRPLHASPFEHIAKPYSEKEYEMRLEHKEEFKFTLENLGFDSEYAETKSKIFLYEGNFKGWSQIRKEISDETCDNYKAK